MTRTNNASELHLTRLYDAPVPQVWDAFTDPQQVAQWWGPRGFTLTSHHKDLRPGGTWVYTMHGPDGVDYPNTTTYLQVERHALLVYDHGASEGSPPLFRVTVRFTDDGGKTRMDMTMALATPEAAAETRRFIKRAGGDATWDRLAEHLAEREGHERFVSDAGAAMACSISWREEAPRLWMLGAGTNWIWTEVVGMTCDHVYLTYASVNGGDAEFNLARVRLDALGPSLPPD